MDANGREWTRMGEKKYPEGGNYLESLLLCPGLIFVHLRSFAVCVLQAGLETRFDDSIAESAASDRTNPWMVMIG